MRRKGVPLSEALEKYSPPNLLEDFERYRERGERLELLQEWHGGPITIPSKHYDAFVEAKRNLVTAFLEQLQTGQLVATGHHKDQPLTAAPSRIPAELWLSLIPNFNDSSASGGGFEIAGILITSAQPRRVRAKKSCKKWFLRKVAAGVRPVSWKAMFKEAQAECGEGLSERAFKEIKDAHAPSQWKKPGRRPSSPPGRVKHKSLSK